MEKYQVHAAVQEPKLSVRLLKLKLILPGLRSAQRLSTPLTFLVDVMQQQPTCCHVHAAALGIWQLVRVFNQAQVTTFKFDSPFKGNPYLIVATCW
jgi:hypothetical protein